MVTTPGPQPGCYPDPWKPGGMRWWSGRDWTAYTGLAPGMGPAQHAPPKEDLAIASLVTSLIGLSPVGIVLGLVARRRIRESGGARGGAGLATAGIATGVAFLTITALVVTLALNGVFAEANADDYSGEEARVARAIDSFEDAYEDIDEQRICRELFTPALARAYRRDGGCETYWGEGESGWSEIDVTSIDMHRDGSANVRADDENDDADWHFTLVRSESGHWLIDGIE